MKKRVILFLIVGCIAHRPVAQTISDPYDFTPLVENNKLRGVPYTEKVKILQIPEAVLQALTTEALLITCIRYPLFHVITAFSNLQEGYEVVSKNFNGFSELYSRQDLGNTIIKQYRIQRLDSLLSIENQYQRGRLIAEIGYFELIISQPEVMSKFSDDGLSQLMNVSYNKFTEKNNFHLSSFSKQFSLLVLGNILNVRKPEWMDGERGKDIKAFLTSAVLKREDTAKDILDFVSDQLKLPK